MLRHTVETCTDDLTQLQQRLDALGEAGARIISVVWQARRVDEDDQSAALDARGSFVIIAEKQEDLLLRERAPSSDVMADALQTQA